MKIYTLKEILELPVDNASEYSYRRGVHQTLAKIASFIEEHDMDALAVIAAFEKYADKFRSDGEDHPLLLDEIATEVHNDEVSRLVSLGLA